MIETRRTKTDSTRGNLAAIRRFRCANPDCLAEARQLIVWVREGGTPSLRRNGPEDMARIEVFPAILVVKD